MRTREIEIGDKVHHRCWQSDYEVVAINNGYAWLRTKDASKGVLAALFNLTRIEPAVPQAKFSVGQTVLSPSGNKMKIVNLCYEVQYKGFPTTWYPERELRPVPEVCQTCGKVGDG